MQSIEPGGIGVPTILEQELEQTKARSRRHWLRAVVLAATGLVLIGCIAPFVNAARLSTNIQRALESSLGRQVEFSRVHFTLFSGPGFSLERVFISDDPRYGLEPFAFVPVLEARVRLDRLLFGEIRFSSLRLVDPSLNLVRGKDGTWNVVELVNRLTAPRHVPLNLFPAFEVSDGRLDFKLGDRKTTLYIADSDLTIYPARSGKVFLEFSGSPARTDRAGNGFGHLRGSLNWTVPSHSGAVERVAGDIILDPSNLSELTTLFQGHDLGVHGTVSSNAHIEGPINDLQITGELRLEDVHRWDLLPSSGEDWRIHYRGSADLQSHRLALDTVPARSGEVSPVGVQLRASNFLGRSDWSIFAQLNEAPLGDLLPLAKRMGLAIPSEADLKGTLAGVIGFSNDSGLQGGIAVTNAVASLPNVPPLRTAAAHVTISGDRIHLDPAIIQTDLGGALQATGDYYLSSPLIETSLAITDFPIAALKKTLGEWFEPTNDFSAFTAGDLSGQFSYSHNLSPTADPVKAASWSGEFQFANATLSLPGLAVPLMHSQGKAVFDATSFDLERLAAKLGDQTIKASYRYSVSAKHPERVHVEIPSADLQKIEAVIGPALEPQGLFARFPFGRRSVPSWLATRNMDGDILIDRFSINDVNLGRLSSRFVWQGTNIQFPSLEIKLPEGLIEGEGTTSFASYAPQVRFQVSALGFPWKGGLLDAQGTIETSGVGIDSIRNIRSSGTFDGENVDLGARASFDSISGSYEFSLSDGWPDLRVSNVEASQEDDSFTGQGASNRDGKLSLDLAGSGQQLHFESSLTPEITTPNPPAATSAVAQK